MNLKTTQWSADNELGFAKASAAAYDTDNGQAGLGALGFTTIKPLPVVNDILGVVAANDDAILCAFRGTISEKNGKLDLNNWVTDAEASQIPFEDCFGVAHIGAIHEGFAKALLPIWPALQQQVAALRQNGQSLWFTGHSLGGGLAHLAAAAFTFALREPVNGLYTYGQPRLGDISFCTQSDAHLGDVYYRTVNDEDIVTRVPPRIFPHFPGFEQYGHSGRLVYFDADGTPHSDEHYWNSFLAAIEVGFQGMQDLIAGKVIVDHFIANYLARINGAMVPLAALKW